MTKRVQVFFGICMTSFLILIDQLTKYFASQQLKEGEYPIIPEIFSLTYLENHGAAFGILQGKKFFLVLIAIVVFFVLAFLYVRLPEGKRFHLLRILIIFLSAGAIGNMIDRILHGYVIDFFNVFIIHFPIFNVADIYVTLASIVLVLSMFFYYKEEDFHFI